MSILVVVFVIRKSLKSFSRILSIIQQVPSILSLPPLPLRLAGSLKRNFQRRQVLMSCPEVKGREWLALNIGLQAIISAFLTYLNPPKIKKNMMPPNLHQVFFSNKWSDQ